jgi:hypothetical protein
MVPLLAFWYKLAFKSRKEFTAYHHFILGGVELILLKNLVPKQKKNHFVWKHERLKHGVTFTWRLHGENVPVPMRLVYDIQFFWLVL